MTSSPTKPSIAILVPAFATAGGGVGVMARFLYRITQESGRYEPHLLSLALSSRDPNSVRLLAPASWPRGVRRTNGTAHDIPYQHIGAFLTEFEFQRYQPRRLLTNLLHQYDLVQVVAGAPALALVARDAARPVCLFTATTIQKERVSVLKRQPGWKRLWLGAMTRITMRIERAALEHVACVFAESDYTRQSIQALRPTTHMVLGVPGVDTTLFAPQNYCPNGPILSVGRFSDHRKNVRLLFAAYARLRQQYPDAPRLVLVGRAPLPADWAYAVSLDIAQCIDIHEQVSNHALAEFYRGASLFVLSSDEEGLGIVILEAMASGLPVVCTRCGGPETAVIEGETGYLTPVGDANALADAMQQLLQSPSTRQQMGQRGRQVAEERFSLAAAGKIYLDQYDALLGR
jgi:glycosyltransferase involved in cell wall biosynthesis